MVSRRALLEQERREAAARTRDRLALGEVLEGTVSRLAPFGAFVDIGGIEGLVHVSQIAHERIAEPGEALRVGQTVRVQVIELQNLGEGRRERVGLSMKALAADPWPETVGSLEVGQEVPGKVLRLVDFGAFVELVPGVEGLIHVSELAGGRVRHPSDVLAEGQQITARVLAVEPERRRISLSLKDVLEPPEHPEDEEGGEQGHS